MKFNKFPLLFIPFLLMGCSNMPSLTLEEAQKTINNFTDATYTHYAIDASIQIFALDINDNSYETDTSLGGGEELLITGDPDASLATNIENGAISSSYYLSAPLKLTSDNFLKYDAKNKIDETNSVYGLIQGTLIYIDSITKIHLEETEEGGLRFAVYNNFSYLVIQNVNNRPSHGIQNNATFSGRINGYFEYNNEGYLVKEEFFSIKYDEKEAATNKHMLHLLSTYTYS